MDWSKLDLEKVVNLVFCISILGLGYKRWKGEGIRAFILVGVGFSLFGVSHLMNIMASQGMLTPDTVAIMKTPLIWGRGLGYLMVLAAMVV